MINREDAPPLICGLASERRFDTSAVTYFSVLVGIQSRLGTMCYRFQSRQMTEYFIYTIDMACACCPAM